jgi:ribulose-phosphate 3-epimerase
MKISASFLSIKENMLDNILKLDNTSIDYLHLDIMDGNFVSNKTWNIEEIKQFTKDTKKPLDVHLMVEDIFKYIDEYKTLNPAFITFHLEAAGEPLKVIKYLKDSNIKVGISVKPNTKISEIEPYLKYLDLVLVMSVEPGMGGQQFIPNSTNKIEELYQLRELNKYNYLIEVDGGINDETISYCKKADILVVGSYITGANDYQEQINRLQKGE